MNTVAVFTIAAVFAVAGYAVRTGPQAEAAQTDLRTNWETGQRDGTVGIIRIPTIGVDHVVVDDITGPALEQGPGHYPTTPLPGDPGNVAVAAHRTTYAAPFADLDQLEPGHLIHLDTPDGRTVTYQVDRTLIVQPDDLTVIGDYGDNRLTLTACHPAGSNRQRIVVQATQIRGATP